MPVMRPAKLIFLTVRKQMCRDCFTLESFKLALNDISMWSETGWSSAKQLNGLIPEQQMI